MYLKKKYTLYLIFLRSTLIISIPVSIAFTFVAGLGYSGSEMPGLEMFSDLISVFLKILCVGGLAASLLYKETVRKNEYYFYFNAGISKISLFIVSFISYVLFSVIIYSICLAIVNNI